jgi:hypothetical protein
MILSVGMRFVGQNDSMVNNRGSGPLAGLEARNG